MVSVLHSGGVVDDAEAAALWELLLQRDEGLLAAFEAARRTGDWDELYDTLHGVINSRRSASSAPSSSLFSLLSSSSSSLLSSSTSASASDSPSHNIRSYALDEDEEGLIGDNKDDGDDEDVMTSRVPVVEVDLSSYRKDEEDGDDAEGDDDDEDIDDDDTDLDEATTPQAVVFDQVVFDLESRQAVTSEEAEWLKQIFVEGCPLVLSLLDSYVQSIVVDPHNEQHLSELSYQLGRLAVQHRLERHVLTDNQDQTQTKQEAEGAEEQVQVTEKAEAVDEQEQKEQAISPQE